MEESCCCYFPVIYLSDRLLVEINWDNLYQKHMRADKLRACLSLVQVDPYMIVQCIALLKYRCSGGQILLDVDNSCVVPQEGVEGAMLALDISNN